MELEDRVTDISRIRLFAKLGPTTYKALDAAATFCKLRGNPHVELVHWLHQLRQVDKSDLNLITKGCCRPISSRRWTSCRVGTARCLTCLRTSTVRSNRPGPTAR